jgi:acyl carrier protein
VKRSSNAMNTPNWDSLAHIDIIEMVERHFKVKFGLGELQDLKEVGDLVDLILEKKS